MGAERRVFYNPRYMANWWHQSLDVKPKTVPVQTISANGGVGGLVKPEPISQEKQKKLDDDEYQYGVYMADRVDEL